jgi:hypothetical protein
MSKLREKAEKYLKEHSADTVFGTSDGFLFLRKQDAKSHGATLKDSKVQTFGKSLKHLKAEDPVDVSGQQTDEGKAKGGKTTAKPNPKTKPQPESKDETSKASGKSTDEGKAEVKDKAPKDSDKSADEGKAKGTETEKGKEASAKATDSKDKK